MGMQAAVKPAGESEFSAPSDLLEIERLMLSAHERHDHDALVLLYHRAADFRFAESNLEAACFYLTHAYVYALETGSDLAEIIRQALAEHGREPSN